MARPAASAAHVILATGPDQVADRHIRVTAGNERADVVIPGALSLKPDFRPDGWVVPKREHEFRGALAAQLLKMVPSLEAMNLRVTADGA